MSILIVDSWDGYGGSATAATGNDWQTGAVFTTTHAKTGLYALGGTGASGVAISRGFGNLTSNLTFSFGIWVYWTGTAPALNGVVFGLPLTSPYTGTNAQCGVTANTSHQLRFERSFNGGTILQTSAACLNTNAWNYITGTIFVDNSGTWDIYCNGVQVLNGSGDTQAQVTAQVGGITIGTGATYWADSLWIWQHTGSFNNTHPGLTAEQVVSAFLPVGAGTTTGLTPSAGSNWQNVDEAPPNSDTDYNAGASNAFDTYAMDWSPLNGFAVYGMRISAWNRSISGTQACNNILRIDGIDNHAPTFNPPTTYRYNNGFYNNNPSSGLAFDYASLATAQLGWRAQGTTARVSQLYADVMTSGAAVLPGAFNALLIAP